MDELKRIEFEIEKVKAQMLLDERIAKVFELNAEEVERKRNKQLDILSDLLRKKKELQK